jgi:hypothetical protein
LAGKVRLSLVLQGGAFVSVATAPQSGLLGAAGLETTIAPTLGLALATQYDGRVTQSFADHALAADAWSLGLRLRWTARSDDRSHVELLAGPAVRLVRAHYQGLAGDAANLALDPVLSAGLRMTQSLASRLEILAGLSLDVCFGRDRLFVPGTTRSLVLDPVRANLAVGLRFALL